MNIQILELIEGARKAKGLTVIIDVFRAMTVEAYIIRNGAADLIPIGSLNEAYQYRETHPETILVGERDGKKCPGFDFGNSPSQVKDVNFSGKVVVHTTSSGTQGIANAKNATEILTGSFVNAKAIADYIKAKNPDDVSLVCMGLAGLESTREDTLCAEYIKSLLEDESLNLQEGFEECRRSSGAKFFDETMQEIFPKADFGLCLEPDIFDFVLQVEKQGDGFMHSVRRNI